MKQKMSLIIHYFLLGMLLFSQVTFGMIGRYQSQKKISFNILAQRYPYIQIKDILSYKSSLLGKAFYVEPEITYLVPTDKDTLKMFDLCPLFEEQKVSIEQDVLALLNAEEIEQLYAAQKVSISPKYHVFNGFEFITKNIDVDVPCTVELGISNNWNRVLMQLKSLDQFELAEKTTLSPALCAGHSLNNGRLIRNYALTGELKYLKKLHDINDAAAFLIELEINDWLNVETVKINIQKVGKALGVEGIDISAVSTVCLFDSDLDKREEFAVYNPQEFSYVQQVKKEIQDGLKQDYFVHVMIIGNEEAAESHGHYFCFAIIKEKNNIQYIVLDTLPGVYHLQEGSHERDRLMFVIDNIEKNSSSIKVANLRTRPEFMQSIGETSEESLLEATLAQERMEEKGYFADQIKRLNDFTKLLNRFGIQKQLAKESQENIVNYLNDIDQIGSEAGEAFAYPTLKKLLKKKINAL